VDRRCAVLGHCDVQWSLRAVGDEGIDVDIGEGSDIRLWPAGFVCGGGGYGSSSNEIA
jgi:hypothetical protein